jgi:hypothetical protein
MMAAVASHCGVGQRQDPQRGSLCASGARDALPPERLTPCTTPRISRSSSSAGRRGPPGEGSSCAPACPSGRDRAGPPRAASATRSFPRSSWRLAPPWAGKEPGLTAASTRPWLRTPWTAWDAHPAPRARGLGGAAINHRVPPGRTLFGPLIIGPADAAEQRQIWARPPAAKASELSPVRQSSGRAPARARGAPPP